MGTDSSGRIATVTALVSFCSFACLCGCALHPRGTSAPGRDRAIGTADSPWRPVPGRATAPVLEQIDLELAATLRGIAVVPSAEGHRRVALAYLERRVLDAAFDHFSSALDADRADAVSYEGRARIWRDWSLPGFALGDAHRATYFAPRSPSAHNTLGTVLQMLGRLGDARTAYERALSLDPEAAYALNNLCSIACEQGDYVSGERLCRRALAVRPDFPEALANLTRVLKRGV